MNRMSIGASWLWYDASNLPHPAWTKPNIISVAAVALEVKEKAVTGSTSVSPGVTSSNRFFNRYEERVSDSTLFS
jgi:hypothetical protein